MIDGLVVLVLALGALSGLRKGFLKKVIGLLALVAASAAAIKGSSAAGTLLARASGLSPGLAFIAGGAVLWIATFVLVIVLGAVLRKQLRGGGAVAAVEGAAEKVVGTGAPGPVTRIMKPLPTARGTLYWIDKAGGAAIGALQGAVLAFLLLLAAPAFVAPERVEASRFEVVAKRDLEPRIAAAAPEVKLVRSLAEADQVAAAAREDPKAAARLRDHPALEPIRSYKPLRDLAEDEELRKAVDERRYGDVLSNPKVAALLKDRELLDRIGTIDWRAIARDLEKAREKKQ